MLNFITEIWKDIPGFEGLYQVSNQGRIRNNRNRILKYYKINAGYYCLKLTDKNGKRHHPLVHRLVIETFNPTKEEKLTVNHINHIKTDNRLKNLEWMSRKENCHDAMDAGLCEHFYTGRHTLGMKHKSQTSKYHNVGWDRFRNKWRACVRHQGKNYGAKRFDTEEEAALYVNYILDTYGFNDRPRNVINKS